MNSAEEKADFWDRNGGQWAASVLKIAEGLGAGIVIDEYSDNLRVRFDGSLEPGGQRITKHNFTEREAFPETWGERK